MKRVVTLTLNGQQVETYVPVHKTLLEVLREDCGLTGTKHGCELGECGACTVLLDDQAALSCLALAVEVEGLAITTIEGVAEGTVLHPLQQAFANFGAAQCGYCIPGMLLRAKALLAQTTDLDQTQIREKMGGNLCRCTGYSKILQAIESVCNAN